MALRGVSPQSLSINSTEILPLCKNPKTWGVTNAHPGSRLGRDRRETATVRHKFIRPIERMTSAGYDHGETFVPSKRHEDIDDGQNAGLERTQWTSGGEHGEHGHSFVLCLLWFDMNSSLDVNL